MVGACGLGRFRKSNQVVQSYLEILRLGSLADNGLEQLDRAGPRNSIGRFCAGEHRCKYPSEGGAFEWLRVCCEEVGDNCKISRSEMSGCACESIIPASEISGERSRDFSIVGKMYMVRSSSVMNNSTKSCSAVCNASARYPRWTMSKTIPRHEGARHVVT